MNILFVLGFNFILLSLVAVGGASATMPEMHRIFVDNLHLMTSTQFSNLYAISQAAPGPNVLFVALFGWQIAGFSGAVISMLAMCGPTSLIAVGVEHFGSRHRNDKWYIVIQRALTPISIGLLCSTGALLMQITPSWSSVLLTALTFALLRRFHFNPLWTVVAGAAAGIAGWV